MVNKSIRAVLVTYEEDTVNAKATRTMFKTLDPSIAVNDLVIIPTDTRHKMTVVKVVETDVDVDFDSQVTVSWIIGKVDAAPYAHMQAMSRRLMRSRG